MLVSQRPRAPAPPARVGAARRVPAPARLSRPIPVAALALAPEASPPVIFEAAPPPPAPAAPAPYAPDAATVLAGLGLGRAAVARLLARATALRRRGRRRAPAGPSAGDVDSAGRALLRAGLKLCDLGNALDRAPGLLNEQAAVLDARVAALALALPRTGVAAVVGHRPAALCATPAAAALAAGLSALAAAGASRGDLGRLARAAPAALWAAPGRVEAAAAALGAAGIPADKIGAMLCASPHALLLGGSAASSGAGPSSARAAAAAALAGAGLAEAAVDAALAAEPALLTVDPSRLSSVLDALVGAGVGGADAAALVAAWPRVLLKSPADVGAKARFATQFLGCPPRALARSPALVFNRRLPTVLAPRFAFVKDRAPALAARVAPATLLRSSDADFAAQCGASAAEYEEFKAWWAAGVGGELAASLEAAGVPAARARPRRGTTRRPKKGANGGAGAAAAAAPTPASAPAPTPRAANNPARRRAPAAIQDASLDAVARLRTKRGGAEG
jgi:hypothetical protein